MNLFREKRLLRLEPTLLRVSDPAGAIGRLETFLGDYAKAASVKGVVLGMSGGLDSSVAAALCARAFRDRNAVLGLCMPEAETYNANNIQDAERVAKAFDIDFKIVDITSIIRGYSNLSVYDLKNKVANGNLKARVRASILFYYSNILNRLVVGTTDKSEMMLG